MAKTLFADDTTLNNTAKDLNTLMSDTQSELNKVTEWFSSNNLHIHPDKTEILLPLLTKSEKESLTNWKLHIKNHTLTPMTDKEHVKFLGININSALTWTPHITNLSAKIRPVAYHLAKVKRTLPHKIKLMIYNSLVKSRLEYGIEIWGGAPKTALKPLILLQKNILRNIINAKYNAHTGPIAAKMSTLNITDLYVFSCVKAVEKSRHINTNRNYASLFPSGTRQNSRHTYLLCPLGLVSNPLAKIITSYNKLNMNSKTYFKLCIKKYKEICKGCPVCLT